VDTNNSQAGSSAAEGQFEDLMGGGLELETESAAPAEDTLDLTDLAEVGMESPPAEPEDLLSMEDSLEMDDRQEPTESEALVEEKESEPGSEELSAEESDDFVSPSEADDREAIKDFKAAVLAFEWEINDENMDNFNRQVSRFKKRWQNNKLLLVFMQILEALGRYIAVARAKADPDSIKLLLSVYAGLEKVVTAPRLTPRGKKKILLAEVDKYNNLKSHLKIAGKQQGERAAKSKTQAGGAAAMMAGHGRLSGDEIIVERTDQEDFPELDARLDSFFDDETLPPDEDQQAAPLVVPPHPEDDSCPAVDSLLDDMFSDVINKGQDDGQLADDEDVVSLDLGSEEESESAEELIIGEELEEVGGSSPVVEDTESLELELSGEEDSGAGEESVLRDEVPAPVEEDDIVLPESLQNIFNELANSSNINDETAKQLLAAMLSLQQEWHDRPLLLTVNSFLVSLARETEAGNEEFRQKSREILLTIYADLQSVVTGEKTDRQLLVASTAEKYLLWKEEVFPVVEFGKTENKAGDIAAVEEEEQESREDDGILLLEPDEEISGEEARNDASPDSEISTDEVQQADDEAAGEEVTEKESEGEQLFDSPEQDNFPEESGAKPGFFAKLKAMFSRR
jgi:hypothetical protein